MSTPGAQAIALLWMCTRSSKSLCSRHWLFWLQFLEWRTSPWHKVQIFAHLVFLQMKRVLTGFYCYFFWHWSFWPSGLHFDDQFVDWLSWTISWLRQGNRSPCWSETWPKLKADKWRLKGARCSDAQLQRPLSDAWRAPKANAGIRPCPSSLCWAARRCGGALKCTDWTSDWIPGCPCPGGALRAMPAVWNDHHPRHRSWHTDSDCPELYVSGREIQNRVPCPFCAQTDLWEASRDLARRCAWKSTLRTHFASHIANSVRLPVPYSLPDSYLMPALETTGVSAAGPVMLRAERPFIAHHWPFALGTECHGQIMSRDVTTGWLSRMELVASQQGLNVQQGFGFKVLKALMPLQIFTCLHMIHIPLGTWGTILRFVWNRLSALRTCSWFLKLQGWLYTCWHCKTC